MSGDARRAAVRLRSALVNAGLLALSLLASLALAEGALRRFGYEYTPLSIDVQTGSDQRHYHAFEDDNFAFDPELIWAPKPNREIFNAQGFRGPELSAEKDPGEYRIVAVGDSNTLGWPGRDGANWPADLQLLARQRGLPVTVVNAGVWGYSSHQGLARLRQALVLRPDLLLISFGSNDAHPVAVSDREYVSRHASGAGWTRRLVSWRLGQLLVATRDRLATSSTAASLQHRVSLDDYRGNLAAMLDLAHEHGAGAVLLTRPYIGESHDPLWWKNFAADYNAATADVARQRQAPLIDLYTAFRDRRTLFVDESHFTREGHRNAAQLVLSQLAPLLY